MRDLDLQSASRRTLPSSRRSVRALPFAAVVIAVATALQPASASASDTTAVSTTASLTTEAAPGGKTILTAHITPAPAAGETGTVTFLDRDAAGQDRELGSTPVSADGSATLTVSSLTTGTHEVRAAYSVPDGSSISSGAIPAIATSATAEVIAQATAPDFSLTAAPTALNLDAGAQGTVTVTVTPTAGFNNYVSLACAGLPLFTTCSFLPSNVSVAGTTGLSTMTLETVSPSGKIALLGRDGGLVYAFLLPGALGLIGLGFSRNRGVRTLAVVCVAFGLMGGASACSQRYRYLNFGPGPNPGTPNGESIIRIFGTSVTGAQSTIKCIQITLNVKSTNTSGSSGNNLTPCS
jgi:Bacterial Ig-like domain (group 3)